MGQRGRPPKIQPKPITTHPDIDLLKQYEDQIQQATLTETGFIEVSKEIFDWKTRNFQGKNLYFVDRNVRVYKPGTKDIIERYENMTMDERTRLESQGTKYPQDYEKLLND